MKVFALALLVIVTVLRLWLSAVSEVSPLEAYYWMCAHHLDWAFFDGPGGTAWLVSLGSLFPGDTPLGLRLAFPIFAALATFATFLLGRALFGEVSGLWAAIALNTLPFFNLAAVHVGPDLPALTFALLAGWSALRALEHRPWWWFHTGVFTALAVQFHYSAILLLAGVSAVCVLSSRHREEWKRPGLYVAFVIAFCGLLPSILWNRAHDWPAFASGTLRTALTPHWSEIPGAIASNVSLFSLTALAALGFAIWTLARSSRIHARPRLVLCLAIPFLLLWFYQLLHGSVPGLAPLLTATILAGGAAHVFLASSRFRQFGAILLLLTSAFILLPQPENRWTRSAHQIGWKEVSSSVDAILARAQKPGAAPLFLIAPDPDATAALNYHLAHSAHPDVFLRESQDASNQFALWPRYDDFVPADKPADDFFKLEGSTTNLYLGRSALYLTDEEPDDLPQTITAAFGHVTTFATLELPGSRKLRVYLCEDYQTMPL